MRLTSLPTRARFGAARRATSTYVCRRVDKARKIALAALEDCQRLLPLLRIEGEVRPASIFVDDLIILQTGLFDCAAHVDRRAETGADEIDGESGHMRAVPRTADRSVQIRAAIAAGYDHRAA